MCNKVMGRCKWPEFLGPCQQRGCFVVRQAGFYVPVPREGSFVARDRNHSCHIVIDILPCCHGRASLPPQALCIVATDLLFCHYRPCALLPRTFCPATTGLRADVGKGRACPPRLLDGELLLLVRAFCPVQRRRTDAVLLLRSTAALVGPAGPFPPIRPKACRSIALSVRATAAKYLSPCHWKGISWYGRSLLFRDVREMMISGAETSLSAPKLRCVKCNRGRKHASAPPSCST